MKRLILLLFIVLSLPAMESNKLPIVNESIEFEQLPTDIKNEIVRYLTTETGATSQEQLQKAAENIRNFSQVNKKTRALFTPQLTGYLIGQLAQNYANDDLIVAALALHTHAAGKWLESYDRAQLEKYFFNAVDKNDAMVVRKLVRLVPSLLIARNHQDQTALERAAAGGDTDIVEELLAQSTRLQMDANPGDALIAAANNGHVDTFDILLTYKKIIPKEKISRALFETVRFFNKQMVKKLIEAGADVNYMGPDGFTPLMYAVANDDVELAKILLNAGASIKIRNPDGLTVVDLMQRFPSSNKTLPMLLKIYKNQ